MTEPADYLCVVCGATDPSCGHVVEASRRKLRRSNLSWQWPAGWSCTPVVKCDHYWTTTDGVLLICADCRARSRVSLAMRLARKLRRLGSRLLDRLWGAPW